MVTQGRQPVRRLVVLAWLLVGTIGLACGAERIEALDHFLLQPASFYQSEDDRMASFAGRRGIATWALLLPAEQMAGKTVSQWQLSWKDARTPVDTTALYIFSDVEGAGLVLRQPPGPVGRHRGLALLTRVGPDAEPGLLHGRLTLTLRNGDGEQTYAVPLTLRVLPLELPKDPPVRQWPKGLTFLEWHGLQRRSLNRYAGLLRREAEAARKSQDSHVFGLARAALREAASQPVKWKLAPDLLKSLVQRLQEPAAGPGLRSASEWDLRRWRAAWLYLRLKQAQTDRDGMDEAETDEAQFIVRFADAEERPPRPPRIISQLAEVAPVIDGQLDDTCWLRTGTIDQLSATSPSDQAGGAARMAQIRICHDSRNIYVGVMAARVPAPGRDQQPETAKQELLRLSLQAAGRSVVLLLRPAEGAEEPARLGRKPLREQQAAVRRFRAHWTAEVSIPLADIMGEARSDRWSLTVERETPSATDAIYRWPAAAPAGELVLAQPTLYLSRFDLPGPLMGRSELRLTLKNETTEALKAQALLAVAFPDAEPLRWRYPLPELPAHKFLRVALPFQIDRPGRCTVALAVQEAETQRLLTQVIRPDMRVPPALALHGQQYFTREGRALVRLRVNLAQQSRRATSLQIALSRPGGLQPIHAEVFHTIKAREATIGIPLAQLGDQTYRLTCSLLEGRQVLWRERFHFAKMPHFLDARPAVKR